MSIRPSDDQGHNPAKNKRPLRTEKMRREGWEGLAMEVPVSLIIKSNVLKRGAPIDQPIERDLKDAIALKYMGLFYRLQAREQRQHRNNPSPQKIQDDEIIAQIKPIWKLKLEHETLKKRAEKAAKKDPRYRSHKAFRHAHCQMDVGIPTGPEAKPFQVVSIEEQKRILEVLCKALERANLICEGWRDVFKNDGRFGEPRNDAKQSALERSLLLSPPEQERLYLTLEDMTDIAIHAWVDPTLICLEYHILSPVFEAVTCAGRCRDGVSGEMTRFSAMALSDVLDGNLRSFCVDDAMFEACLGIYSAAIIAFNAHADLSPKEFKARMQKQLAHAIGTSDRLEDKVTIYPLAAPGPPAA